MVVVLSNDSILNQIVNRFCLFVTSFMKAPLPLLATLTPPEQRKGPRQPRANAVIESP
jgi:hypothetical protein